MFTFVQFLAIALAIPVIHAVTSTEQIDLSEYNLRAQRELQNEIALVDFDIDGYKTVTLDRYDVIGYQQSRYVNKKVNDDLQRCADPIKGEIDYYVKELKIFTQQASTEVNDNLAKYISDCSKYLNNFSDAEDCYIKAVAKATRVVKEHLNSAKDKLNYYNFRSSIDYISAIKCTFDVEQNAMGAGVKKN